MNQEFAIESFISFCDDMMIAEEGDRYVSKYKGVSEDVIPIVSKLDATKAKEFILSELDNLDTDTSKRNENVKKWKEFKKKVNHINYFFKKENKKLFEGVGSLHKIPVVEPELRDYFNRFKALVHQSFTENEMKTLVLIGNSIFIQNHDLKTREDIEAEATTYNDDLY